MLQGFSRKYMLSYLGSCSDDLTASPLNTATFLVISVPSDLTPPHVQKLLALCGLLSNAFLSASLLEKG